MMNAGIMTRTTPPSGIPPERNSAPRDVKGLAFEPPAYHVISSSLFFRRENQGPILVARSPHGNLTSPDAGENEALGPARVTLGPLPDDVTDPGGKRDAYLDAEGGRLSAKPGDEVTGASGDAVYHQKLGGTLDGTRLYSNGPNKYPFSHFWATLCMANDEPPRNYLRVFTEAMS